MMRAREVLVVLVIFVVLFFSSAAVLAEEWQERQLEVSAARWSLAKKTGGFVAGVAFGVLGHEAGHQLVGSLEGVQVTWRNSGDFVSNNWWASTNSKSSLRDIALAGFGAQVLSTEVILGVKKIPKDNAFVFGWLAFNLVNSISYVIVNEWLSAGHGDLKTLRETGMDIRWLEAGLVAHTLLSAYRVYKDPKFIPYVHVTSQEFIVGVSWRW